MRQPPFYDSEHGDHGWTRPKFAHLSSGITARQSPSIGSHSTSSTKPSGKPDLHCKSAAQPPLSNLAISGMKLTAVPF